MQISAAKINNLRAKNLSPGNKIISSVAYVMLKSSFVIFLQAPFRNVVDD
jgi:hypothetical protein